MNWFDEKPVFRDLAGKSFKNPKRIKALQSLGVPPAWRHVRFAHQDSFHIQAVGDDARGRKQYRYHPQWVDVRNEIKAMRLLEIGRGLPALREKVKYDLKGDIDALTTVCATAVRLIDDQLIRVGSEQYIENGTVGCATLPNSAFMEKSDQKYLRYRGKSGRKTEIALRDKNPIKRIAELNDSGGPRLFTFIRAGEKELLRAQHINDYIRQNSGRNFTAKDFRTFKASAAALALLSDETFEPTRKPRLRVAAAVRRVGERLRNTPAVCRSSYIHPTIIHHA